MTGKATHLKNSNPDRGLLLICLMASVLIAIFGGLIVSAESENPIETLMFFFRDGMSVTEVGGEVLEVPDGTADEEPTFIASDITG